MSTTPLSIQDFAAKIRGKYPGTYDDLSDSDLTNKVLTKYPQYSDMVLTKAAVQETKTPPAMEPQGAVSRFAEGALSVAGLPTSISNIPSWALHMIGQAPDSKPFWDDIHQAVKNPTQENIVKAIPLVGPTAVAMSQQAQQGNVAGLLGSVAGIVGGIKGAQAIPVGIAARQAEAADKARLAAYSDLNKAIPATKSAPYTPEDLQRAQPYLVKEHADSPITTVEDLRDSAGAAIRKIESRVGNAIEQSPTQATVGTTLDDVKSVLAQNARGAGFVKAGLKELDDFNLGEPKTLTQKDAIRRQLNAENTATLRKNNYTVDIARKSDPTFAAREAAAESLRNEIYGALDKQGYDMRPLRQDEGSLIKLRNAAENQMFNAEKKVAGSGGNTLARTLLGFGIRSAGAGIGGAAGGGFGAMAGSNVGGALTNFFKAENLTRNELVERSFSIPQGNPTPFGPSTALSGAASIGDILKAKGFNPLQINQQQQTPQLPFHPGAGIPKP